MKCPVCDGRGFFPVSNIAAKLCPQCNGTGNIEQTNEEWFDTLPTTKKADFMAKTVVEAIKEHNKCGTTRCESVIWWDEWLKQPHERKQNE